jgi:transketolase
VFPDGVPVISIEASCSHGWAEWSHSSVGLTTYGLSAPFAQVYERFGLTVEKIVEHSQRVVEYYKANPVPSLVHRVRFEGASAPHH